MWEKHPTFAPEKSNKLNHTYYEQQRRNNDYA